MSVSKRFDTFLSKIKLTDVQKTAGQRSRESAVKAVNFHYYASSNGTANSKFVGSWGKYTRLRPPRDVDVLYVLPWSVHTRFEKRQGNKQSQILQEVKSILYSAFPSTAVKGSGPIVSVPFSSYNVELIPSFKFQDGTYWICRTNNGGFYEKAAYDAEATAIQYSNDLTSGMTRNLIRMMKRWQHYCSVPLRSFWIELIAKDFLSTWEHKGKTMIYYDWMVRDFLKYLENKENGIICTPGTYEIINIGNAWSSKCKTARKNAEEACASEGDNVALAGVKWQYIFGTDMPIIP